jgi:hypothetical protein
LQKHFDSSMFASSTSTAPMSNGSPLSSLHHSPATTTAATAVAAATTAAAAAAPVMTTKPATSTISSQAFMTPLHSTTSSMLSPHKATSTATIKRQPYSSSSSSSSSSSIHHNWMNSSLLNVRDLSNSLLIQQTPTQSTASTTRATHLTRSELPRLPTQLQQQNQQQQPQQQPPSTTKTTNNDEFFRLARATLSNDMFSSLFAVIRQYRTRPDGAALIVQEATRLLGAQHALLEPLARLLGVVAPSTASTTPRSGDAARRPPPAAVAVTATATATDDDLASVTFEPSSSRVIGAYAYDNDNDSVFD